MDELKLTGNHLKGSRPVLSFDGAFDQEPHLQLLKELFTQVWMGGRLTAPREKEGEGLASRSCGAQGWRGVGADRCRGGFGRERLPGVD
jgi:hypothetical protein